jgi:hypothetical protein
MSANLNAAVSAHAATLASGCDGQGGGRAARRRRWPRIGGGATGGPPLRSASDSECQRRVGSGCHWPRTPQPGSLNLKAAVGSRAPRGRPPGGATGAVKGRAAAGALTQNSQPQPEARDVRRPSVPVPMSNCRGRCHMPVRDGGGLDVHRDAP